MKKVNDIEVVESGYDSWMYEGCFSPDEDLGVLIIESPLDEYGVIKMYSAEFVIIDEEYDGFLVTANTEDFTIHCVGSSHLTFSRDTLITLTKLYNKSVSMIKKAEGSTT